MDNILRQLRGKIILIMIIIISMKRKKRGLSLHKAETVSSFIYINLIFAHFWFLLTEINEK